VLILPLALCIACSKKSAGAGDRGNTDTDRSGSDSDIRPGECASSTDCVAPKICHPFALVCVDPGTTCSEQVDCLSDTYCERAVGVCLPGTTGSPCATNDNCLQSCTDGVCGCTGLAFEQQIGSAALDIYLIFDASRSMGQDCAYVHGSTPPQDSKACYATYALADYLIDVSPSVDTRLAFQFLPLSTNACSGQAYDTPLIDLTTLPVAESHNLIQEISDATFNSNQFTNIEGALRGLAAFTAANVTPGREMIGVLMTDGDPLTCEQDVPTLADILAQHYADTGLRTFIIGMTGATEANLEEIGEAGGTTPHDDWCGAIGPPCHYWNVGDGSGDALANALQGIIALAVPLPCQLDVLDLTPPDGEHLDFDNVNVNLTQGTTTTTMGEVADVGHCPSDTAAWYYDNPSAPTMIVLCPSACNLVSGVADGARVSVTVACTIYEPPM
jgi:hypothetical protein